MTDAMSDRLEVGSLVAGFAGAVLSPGEPWYDDARAIFNSMIDRRPAVMAHCASKDDVIAAVRFARERGLEIAVRGGGHSVAGAGLSDSGVVIDLRRMSTVSVDAAARTARVGGGATWGDFDRACQQHGLATTGGRVSTTGVAGLTLGEGSGWLERQFGLACDSLISFARAGTHSSTPGSEEQNPELFWALHGGGGNFGVATELTFRLQPLPQLTFGLLLWSSEAGADVLRGYRELMAGAPDELGGGASSSPDPPEEFVPKHLVGDS